MRTLKFRAWDKDEKNMLYAGVHDRNWYATPKNDSGGCHTVRGKMPEDRICLEMMQFTGLLDRNGKEIFEDDIVKDENTVFKVVFDCSQWQLIKVSGAYQYPSFYSNAKRMEVIGNIYEHKNLLEAGK